MALDVVVVGLGAMGSAALYQMAKRGMRVLGIERFEPGHDRGSSHGLTRIIRMGYFEHPSYVPLVRRAYALWRDLEAASGDKLLTATGIAEMGLPDSVLVAGTLASSRQHNLSHEVLDARTLMQRYPQFRLPPDFVGVIQPDGGFLEPEKAIHAQLALAKAAGAEVRTGEKVLAIEPTSSGVRVTTERGTVEAGRAILAAGAWASTLLPKGTLPLHVTRQALIWVAPKEPSIFTPDRFPVFMIESEGGIHYGFPLHDGALKIALHHHVREKVDPETYDRTVSPNDEALIRPALAAFLPAADGPQVATKTCLYTMTPDEDFVVGPLPGIPNIIVASPCSGHGFKFSPAIGEIVADLAAKGETRHDISRFSPGRFH
ncbi:MAG: N-methyl-L-tryptophan oxidase [Pseudorhodoplanes sp.]|nr:N-methyl-L-tryptophan oxidase [Pseudorhodoplanes sp.]